MKPRSIYLLQLLLLVLHIAAAALAFQNLPERFPIHFDLAGNADNWADRSLIMWFTLPIVNTVVALFLFGMSKVAIRTPEIWNLPQKKRFLALTPEQREPVVAIMLGFLAWIGVMTTIIFICVHALVYMTAVGWIARPTWPALLLVFGPIGVVLVMTIRLWKRVNEGIGQAG